MKGSQFKVVAIRLTDAEKREYEGRAEKAGLSCPIGYDRHYKDRKVL